MSEPIVKEDQTGRGLYVTQNYAVGDVVLEFRPVGWRSKRGKHTLQHPSGRHMYDPVLAMAPHSCEPNCRVSFDPDALIAIRAIASGDAITFDYQTTESVITHPFTCICGSPRCRGWIG